MDQNMIYMLLVYFQVAGRSLGELVRKLGERVLPLIIPILSKGLKDSSTSRRQVSLTCIFLFEEYYICNSEMQFTHFFPDVGILVNVSHFTF